VDRETIFKETVRGLIERGVYPGPTAINRALGRDYYRVMNTIGGRECQWRREVCNELGFRLKGRNLGD
jgi:hypothetical protein